MTTNLPLPAKEAIRQQRLTESRLPTQIHPLRVLLELDLQTTRANAGWATYVEEY
jgi:hypothetical protein